MPLRDLILPAACASCRAEGRGPLCLACESAVSWIEPPLCARCGLPGRTAVDGCRECRRRWSFDAARAAARYEGPARDALIAYKLLGERRFALALARPMLETAVSLAVPFDAVAFVPATRRSVTTRGFNPARELARPIARSLRVPMPRLLAKLRDTSDQAGLGREARRANLAGAFAARRRSPACVLLVDDILTTGATADACARALLDGGARRVYVVTFARSFAVAGRPTRTTVGTIRGGE